MELNNTYTVKERATVITVVEKLEEQNLTLIVKKELLDDQDKVVAVHKNIRFAINDSAVVVMVPEYPMGAGTPQGNNEMKKTVVNVLGKFTDYLSAKNSGSVDTYFQQVISDNASLLTHTS